LRFEEVVKLPAALVLLLLSAATVVVGMTVSCAQTNCGAANANAMPMVAMYVSNQAPTETTIQLYSSIRLSKSVNCLKSKGDSP
jgi:hypothetical protein